MRFAFYKYVKKAKLNKKNSIRGIAVLSVLSVIVSLSVFMGLRQTGLTLAGTAMCGIEEHSHTDKCFEKQLICTVQESDHTHTEECFEKHLLCDKAEHVHTIDCYADLSADVETQLDWQSMFDGRLTGDLRTDLVSIARSQIGYTESVRNFTVDESGVRSGYTRYGAWYGLPYSDWSAMFVSFCLHYAGSDSSITPYNTGATSMAELWYNAGRYASAREYSPESGDLIFFDNNTVGIVSSVSFDVLTVVRGDIDNAVVEQTIMTYDSSIYGYGILTAPSLFTANPLHAVSSYTALTLNECNCGNAGAAAISHSDVCAYKSQLISLADTKTAADLYTIWAQLPSDAQDYILSYLLNNAWKYGTKYYELKALLESAGAETTLNASCGNVSFQATGDLPSSAALQVYDPQYPQSVTLSYINPNIQSNVKWMAVYDISLTENGIPYTPTSPVTVTVTLPNLVFDPSSEFFAVAHLNGTTGEILSNIYVEVVGNTVTFTADSFSPYLFYTVDQAVEGGERILGTNWLTLRDSGYFTYWEQFLYQYNFTLPTVYAMNNTPRANKPSSTQIDNRGGSSTNGDGVVVSKTIDGTELENVFDITLTVQTQQSISEVYEEPDMAVVIVMDISNSMKDNFGGTSRYEAAMVAAENFLDQFAAKTGKISKIGYVAFNTDAHEIFGLSSCSSTAEAAVLKNTMRQKTGAIINASGYGESHKRFTNIEAGLKRGYDMLASAQNEFKYLIFLSDGFPTTYVSSGYTGYDPYTPSGTPGTSGVFYDFVQDCHCDYGTSYSDTAAIRAREQAAKIKADGVKIFSIGIDVGGQTIAEYERPGKYFSIIERTSTNYEIGNAYSTDSYINWLQNSIGSGYYYDSTNAAGLKDAYDKIFAEILRIKESSSEADWVAEDPIPLAPTEHLEFIGFYDKNGSLLPTDRDLSGLSGEGNENTATFDYKAQTQLNTITWDLKNSGYTKTVVGGVTTYSYQLVYRVRLKNEMNSFVENQVYDTNAPTSLTYRIFESTNGVATVSKQKTLAFQIPAVHGYLADLTFTKIDSYGNVLAGAEFTLSHNDAACPLCRGDGTSHVDVPVYTAISAADGTVTFTRIPSGHTYTLQETKAPPGYVSDNTKYTVVVSYDVLIVYGDWSGTVVNRAGAEFPSTGGSGISPYILTGATLIVIPVVYGYIRWRRRERRSDV